MHTNHHKDELMGDLTLQLLLAMPFVLLLVIYLVLVVITIHRHKPWPFYRVVLWFVGVSCAMGAVAGPIAVYGHINFKVHMIGHLLLGMLAPLLMVLAAPLTLIFRMLNVRTARTLSRILRTKPIRFINKPIVASFLNVGGLWVLYTSSLYNTMQQSIFLHMVVHYHVFLAGFVFTSAFINIDPTPHRTSFVYRAMVLVLALTGHNILSKYIYAYPPQGISVNQAESGAILMYYGGDAIDLILIIILCFQWYKATRPQRMINNHSFQVE
ncbi:cytochrome c oxidase assembly protein [Neobacillus rhizosphaerae]|uniref:cytochrome c oxidase assembly protein n=1 Tax=Neobacillus rhizosphaerae TaxID=2880965 RepID=UPI003D2A57B3